MPKVEVGVNTSFEAVLTTEDKAHLAVTVSVVGDKFTIRSGSINTSKVNAIKAKDAMFMLNQNEALVTAAKNWIEEIKSKYTQHFINNNTGDLPLEG